MTKRQTAIAIIALIVIVACIVVAIMYPPDRDYFSGVSKRSATLRNTMYLAAAGTAVLALILALSPWGRSKD